MNNGAYGKNRIFYYDILRAFAIFCIVACHVFAEYVSKTNIFGTPFWYYAICFHSLANIGVPLFVILSGSLLLDRKDTLINFVKKRFSRVIIPYIFWGVIFTLAFAFIFNKGTVMEVALKVFSFAPSGYANFFWFVPMILITYILIFIINKLNEYNDKTLIICLILSLVLIALINLKYLPVKKPIFYFYYPAFAVFGYYLSNVNLSYKTPRLSNKKLMIIFLIFSILFYLAEILTVTSLSFKANHFKTISQFSFLNILVTFTIFLFIRYFEENGGKIFNYIKKGMIGKIIYSLSICSYGIYLSHIVIKNYICLILLPVKNSISITVFTTGVLIMALLLPWMVILILGKIPILDKLSGYG